MNKVCSHAELGANLLIARTQYRLVRAKAAGKVLGRPFKTSDSQPAEIVARWQRGTLISAFSCDYGISRANVMPRR